MSFTNFLKGWKLVVFMVNVKSPSWTYSGEDTCESAPADVEVRSFYHVSVPVALRASQSNGFSTLAMPAVLEKRLECDNDSPLWGNWSLSVSSFLTGRTKSGSHTKKGGNSVGIFSHIPTMVSDPNVLERRIAGGQLVDGALVLPHREIYRVLALDGQVVDGVRVVTVFDAKDLEAMKYGYLSENEALTHTGVLAFVGSKKMVCDYVPRHMQKYTQLGFWLPKGDLQFDQLRGRLLVLGYFDYDSFLGNDDLDLDGSGRFLGVRPLNSAVGAKKK